ncbi:hypothetical protein DQX05_27190 [Paenibacillus thiaminolyticus]|uniref:Uncharacterized protein n=1 Tax=Paenibacillus thiaminolyticus TaxID=49283 RepID=A0A3A3GE77_PANTH|nr:hypothetical protein DQX05_27190 [Paenibacillus thiaminolyticus]
MAARWNDFGESQCRYLFLISGGYVAVDKNGSQLLFCSIADSGNEKIPRMLGENLRFFFGIMLDEIQSRAIVLRTRHRIYKGVMKID